MTSSEEMTSMEEMITIKYDDEYDIPISEKTGEIKTIQLEKTLADVYIIDYVRHSDRVLKCHTKILENIITYIKHHELNEAETLLQLPINNTTTAEAMFNPWDCKFLQTCFEDDSWFVQTVKLAETLYIRTLLNKFAIYISIILLSNADNKKLMDIIHQNIMRYTETESKL